MSKNAMPNLFYFQPSFHQNQTRYSCVLKFAEPLHAIYITVTHEGILIESAIDYPPVIQPDQVPILLEALEEARSICTSLLTKRG